MIDGTCGRIIDRTCGRITVAGRGGGLGAGAASFDGLRMLAGGEMGLMRGSWVWLGRVGGSIQCSERDLPIPDEHMQIFRRF